MRSIVRNVSRLRATPLGFSGTNMRYVTITKSRVLQQRARASCRTRSTREKYPPAEDNVIIDNDIFWNNFNFHAGAAVPGAQAGRHRGARAGRHRHHPARRPRQP